MTFPCGMMDNGHGKGGHGYGGHMELSKTFGLVEDKLPQSPNDGGGFSL